MKTSRTSSTRISAYFIETLESRIAPAFATALDISAFAQLSGFTIHGVALDGALNTVTSAGDLNGDGFDDVIVDAVHRAPAVVFGGGSYYPTDGGASYVVFGKSGGFPKTLELSTLDGTNGFKFIGEASAGFLGQSASAAGDVNGDGIADVIVGALHFTPDGGGLDGSASYVVFGHRGAFAATLDLGSLTGANGFKINGSGGIAVGDVNGDGFGDVLVGAPVVSSVIAASPPPSYVVFGHSGPFAATLDLSTLTGTNGFRITPEPNNGFANINRAGDVNGDGFDDVLIGVRSSPHGENSGKAIVLFGHGGTFAPTLDLAGLNGTNGFTINGFGEDTAFGTYVSNAGDINGDGFGDVIIGTDDGGGSYVVLGHSGAFPAVLELTDLKGSVGFVIADGPSEDDGGSSVHAGGDVNGDGIADLLIGSPHASYGPAGDDLAGISYVVYGHHGAFPDTLQLSNLDDTTGFRITGTGVISSAGDVNGDGLDDLIVGGDDGVHVLFAPGFTRLAPTISGDGKTAHFIDTDGDRVTVKTTRGTFDASNFAIYALPDSAARGGQFSGLDLSDAEFAGADISITAKHARHGGNGMVNLGFLDATGIDLGRVRIDGDLGRIEAGDADPATAGIGSLSVKSMGAFGQATQFDIARDVTSRVVGSIDRTTIAKDVRGVTIETGGFGMVNIGGSIEEATISAGGSIRELIVGGNIKHSNIFSDGSIGSIGAGRAPGTFNLEGGVAVKGSIVGSRVSAGHDLSRVSIGGHLLQSVVDANGDVSPVDLLAAQTIGEIAVKGRVESSYFQAGGTGAPDVQVGRISVGGSWVASGIYVGNGSANESTLVGGIPAIIASIASISIKGRVSATIAGTYFFAEQILAFKSNGVSLPLTAGRDVFQIGTDSNVTLREWVGLV